ncbi:FadR/GntR family transcriptional regulator [Marinivivus vitaminiproducens]|uniref:FadR/GntR family transcriptional regulator n=1 Tax=Marinivivus vitaminiproducens TaxID=3035935 RepID=UPI0027A14D68|nr:FCD domain-containing protein [Geminicoccaceae bacterium SCSIO 64248]
MTVTIRDNRSAGERIADQLAEQIKQGVYPVGEAIPSERVLADSFGVSRPTVHQAVLVLARQGYLVLADGRRPRVALPKPERLEGFPVEAVAAILRQEDGHAGLEQLRQLIELGAVRLIARAGALNHIGKLLMALREGEEAGSPEAFVAADMSFHRALIGCIENPIVSNLYDSFIGELFRRRTGLAVDRSRWPRVLGQHRDIIDAIRVRDHLSAATILEDHLMDAYTSSLAGPQRKPRHREDQE